MTRAVIAAVRLRTVLIEPSLAMLELVSEDATVGAAFLRYSPDLVTALRGRASGLVGTSAFSWAARARAARPPAEEEATRSATSAIENAAADLCARTVGAPLYELLGGQSRTIVEVSAAIPLDQGVELARRVVDRSGYRHLTLVTDATRWVEACDMLEMLRREFGRAMHLRLRLSAPLPADAAEQMHQRVEMMHLAHVEDDVAPRHASPLVKTPRALRRTLSCIDDLTRALHDANAQVLMLELDRCGGVPAATRLSGICRAFQVELGIGASLQHNADLPLAAHLAIALPEATKGVEVAHHDATLLWRETPIVRDGFIVPLEGAGTGADPIDDVLDDPADLNTNALATMGSDR